VPIAEIGCKSGSIHSLICFNHKTSLLWENQQAHLFVAEQGKVRYLRKFAWANLKMTG